MSDQNKRRSPPSLLPSPEFKEDLEGFAKRVSAALMPPPRRPTKKRSASQTSVDSNDADREFEGAYNRHPAQMDANMNESFSSNAGKMGFQPGNQGNAMMEVDQYHDTTNSPVYDGAVRGIPPLSMNFVASFLAQQGKPYPDLNAPMYQGNQDWMALQSGNDGDGYNNNTVAAPTNIVQPVSAASMEKPAKKCKSKRAKLHPQTTARPVIDMQNLHPANAPFVYHPRRNVERREVAVDESEVKDQDPEDEEGLPVPVGLGPTPPSPDKVSHERQLHPAHLARVGAAHDRLSKVIFGDEDPYEVVHGKAR